MISTGSRGATVLLCAVLVGLVATPAKAVPESPEAKAELQKGIKAFDEGDYDAAIEAYQRGYDIEPDAAFLMGMGQAEFKRGRCKAAIRYYRQVKERGDAPPAMRDAANEGIIACAEIVATEDPEPVDEVEEPVEEPQDDEPLAAPPPSPEPTDDEPRKWYLDPLGDTLVAVGVAAGAAGGGLLIAAQVESGKDVELYQDFDDRVDRIRRWRIAGGATLGVGGALIVGGVIRWAVLGSRAKRRTARVGVHYDGALAGLSVAGRF